MITYTRTSLPRPPAAHRRLGQQIRVEPAADEARYIDLGMKVLGFTQNGQMQLSLPAKQ